MTAYIKHRLFRNLRNWVRWVKLLPKMCRTWRELQNIERVQAGLGDVDSNWRRRIDDVLASPDNAHIDRVSEAGQIESYYISMHNGVKVCANGYYGYGTLNMLVENKGVHEPQEERVFEAVIRLLPVECTMLEMGAYWGFYSLSLLQQRPQAQCYLVEPIVENLISGRLNFRLNGRNGHFINAYIDAEPDHRGVPGSISVDAFCEEHKIKHLNILHADIQGFEDRMLHGSKRMLTQRSVDYVFISTHSNPIHYDCVQQLEKHDFTIIASADMHDTFSEDGLIVAKRSDLPQPEMFEISRKK